MNGLATRQFYLVVILAFIALVLNAAIPIYSLQMLKSSNAETLAARTHVEILDQLMLSAVDAETGMRGYVITGNSNFLEPYFNSQARINTLLNELEMSSKSDASIYPVVKEFKHKILYMLERHKQTVDARQFDGEDAATSMVMSGEGKQRMDAVREVSLKLRLFKNNKLGQLVAHQSQVVTYTNNALIFLTLVDLILFGLAFVFLLKSLKASNATQAHLNHLHVESLKTSALLTQKNHVQHLQARLNEALQSVLTTEEAYLAISNYCLHLFPQYSGALYIKSNSKDYFERKSNWGSIQQVEGFEPDGCWAARNNGIYRYDYLSQNMSCAHYAEMDHSHLAICLAVSTSEEMLGTLTLISEDNIAPDIRFDEDVEVVAQEVVGYIGLAINNLRLRENLKRSAIIDVLTGLFNRRYLTEHFRVKLPVRNVTINFLASSCWT